MIAKKCFPNSVIKAVCALVGNKTFSKHNTIIVLGLSNNSIVHKIFYLDDFLIQHCCKLYVLQLYHKCIIDISSKLIDIY